MNDEQDEKRVGAGVEERSSGGSEELVPDIQPQELQALIMSEEPVQVIDVRSDHEWEAGHVPGATHVRLDVLPERTSELDEDRDLVFYCRAGNRSGMAAQAFREAGYRARVLSGGMLAWSETGLDMEPEGGYVAESGEAAAVLEARRRN
ncbi:MAG TPA: rhodanese-like domain-containing protein [Solirubrobacterales bacterium]|nr:rhodanese-like domain-containing protein [Solirubrobacterales bacterium]